MLDLQLGIAPRLNYLYVRLVTDASHLVPKQFPTNNGWVVNGRGALDLKTSLLILTILVVVAASHKPIDAQHWEALHSWQSDAGIACIAWPPRGSSLKSWESWTDSMENLPQITAINKKPVRDQAGDSSDWPFGLCRPQKQVRGGGCWVEDAVHWLPGHQLACNYISLWFQCNQLYATSCTCPLQMLCTLSSICRLPHSRCLGGKFQVPSGKGKATIMAMHFSAFMALSIALASQGSCLSCPHSSRSLVSYTHAVG